MIPTSAPAGAPEQVSGALLPPCVASTASKHLGTELTRVGLGSGGLFGFVVCLFQQEHLRRRKWTLKNSLYSRSSRIKFN